MVTCQEHNCPRLRFESRIGSPKDHEPPWGRYFGMRTRHLTFLILSVTTLVFVGFPGLPRCLQLRLVRDTYDLQLHSDASSLSSGGGDVYFAANTSGASSCVLSASPSVKGLPKTVKCANQLLSWPAVLLPQNSSSQPVTYTFSLTAAPLFGGTGSAVAGPISVSVSPPGANVYVALGDSYAAGEGNPGPSSDPSGRSRRQPVALQRL